MSEQAIRSTILDLLGLFHPYEAWVLGFAAFGLAYVVIWAYLAISRAVENRNYKRILRDNPGYDEGLE